MWWRYYQEREKEIRPAVVDAVIKLLACGLSIMGYATYRCGKPGCNHTKRIYFGCHHRYCPTCGKKRTDQWIETMRAMLPNTEWQHITFTMPDVLWPIFKQNRHLLKHLSRLAATTLLDFSAKKGLTPGLFSALHTFGRNLKWNTHVHLSASRIGLTEQGQGQSLFFPKAVIMRQWRYREDPSAICH
jgi:hypothetical protein